jgi:hypothetical protein
LYHFDLIPSISSEVRASVQLLLVPRIVKETEIKQTSFLFKRFHHHLAANELPSNSDSPAADKNHLHTLQSKFLLLKIITINLFPTLSEPTDLFNNRPNSTQAWDTAENTLR